MLERLSKKRCHPLYFILQANAQITKSVVRTSSASSSNLMFSPHLKKYMVYWITIETNTHFAK